MSWEKIRSGNFFLQFSNNGELDGEEKDKRERERDAVISESDNALTLGPDFILIFVTKSDDGLSLARRSIF